MGININPVTDMGEFAGTQVEINTYKHQGTDPPPSVISTKSFFFSLFAYLLEYSPYIHTRFRAMSHPQGPSIPQHIIESQCSVLSCHIKSCHPFIHSFIHCKQAKASKGKLSSSICALCLSISLFSLSILAAKPPHPCVLYLIPIFLPSLSLSSSTSETSSI